jgi:biopolymer transport protein ExbB/TolQ
MDTAETSLIDTLMRLPIFEAEWVLWLLFGLSFVSICVMIERVWFYHSHRVDVVALRKKLDGLLGKGDFAGAARALERHDTLETNVVLFGLRQYGKGPEAVEELLAGAEAMELQRYQKRLGFLATLGNNAPFIGLFGTVLGIIKAFGDLGGDLGMASGDLMDGIAEALVLTGVGLLVAIPSVVAYNAFSSRVKVRSANLKFLSHSLLAELKSERPSEEAP